MAFHEDSEIPNHDLSFSNVKIEGIKHYLMRSDSGEAISNLKIENCEFVFSKVEAYWINLRGTGTTALFKSNKFINEGSIYSGLILSGTGTNVEVFDNTYSGFSDSLCYFDDPSKCRNNRRT